MGRRPLPKRITPFVLKPLTSKTSWGISSPFELLSLASGQVTNALLTRSPLGVIANPSFDLHVLSTPPAFILSQDQTLRKKFSHLTMRFSSLLQFWLLYHSSVVKVLCVSTLQRPNADVLLLDIGSSAPTYQLLGPRRFGVL